MYIGRFAPSPTGPLHFGSLLAALASFLDARHHQGKWLLRIEDIDPPRSVPAAIHRIPETLSAFGLEWDGEISHQSNHHLRYETALHQLQENQCCYYCTCSRKMVAQRHAGVGYDRFCRTQQHTSGAVRFISSNAELIWHDAIQGKRTHAPASIEDFLLRRRDALWAYHLAVVVDDAAAGITHVVRGYDLIDETAKQILLQQALHYQTPSYAHIPIVTTTSGQKLSKQNLAKPLDLSCVSEQIAAALAFLGHPLPEPLLRAAPQAQLRWATEHWSMERIPKRAAMAWPGV